MKTLQNVDAIEKVMRAQLIAQSEVNQKFVRNSLSIHGEALEKLLEEQIYSSISTNDAMILFEFRDRLTDSDGSETNEDGSISYYKSYKLYVIIYGDNSTNIANNIVARFRTEAVRLALRDEGIYLEQISEASKINEYKNETMWLRNDIEIDISCQLSISQITNENYFDKLNSLELIK